MGRGKALEIAAVRPLLVRDMLEALGDAISDAEAGASLQGARLIALGKREAERNRAKTDRTDVACRTPAVTIIRESWRFACENR